MSTGAVLFDLYGTLADIEVDEQEPNPWAALKVFLGAKANDLTPLEIQARFNMLCDQETSIHGEGFALTSAFRKLLIETGRNGSEAEITSLARAFRRRTTKSLIARPYSVSLLTELRRNGLRLALISNTEAIVTNYDIEALDFAGYFDAIVLSSEFGAKKPEPAIFLEALQKLSAEAQDAIFVGDTWETDIQGALQVRMWAVYLDHDMPPLAVKRDDLHSTVLHAHPDGEAIRSALGTILSG